MASHNILLRDLHRIRSNIAIVERPGLANLAVVYFDG